MSERWYIYKGDQTLGPYTPSEIRDALRDGTIDPFDVVARQGSTVRRALIEVDELFVNSKISYLETAERAHVEQAESAAQLQLAGRANMTAVSGRAELVAGQGHLALADDRATRAVNGPTPEALGRRSRRDPKHFHLIDARGRSLGPISAGEIQALYYRGVVDQNAKVMRDGSSKAVAVARFVAAYSEAKGGAQRSPIQGGHPSVQVNAAAPNHQHHGALRGRLPQGFTGGISRLTIAIMALALLLSLAALALVIIGHSSPRWLARLNQNTSSPTHTGASPLAHPANAPVNPTRGTVRLHSASPVAPAKAPLANASELAMPAPPPQLPAAPPPRAKVTIHTPPRALPQTQVTPHHVVPSLVHKTPAAVQLPTLTAVPFAAKTAPPAPQKPTSPGNGGQLASLVDGQTVSHFGPLAFDKAALDACQNGCNIPFSGGGGTVRVVFFKQAWGPSLAQKSGGAYVSGLVHKDGANLRLVLSNVE